MGQAADGIPAFDEFYAGLRTARHEHYRRRGETRVRSAEAFDEQRSHLLALYRDVHPARSFTDATGQIFDCVPLHEQRALRGRRPTPPRSLPVPSRGEAPAAPRPEATRCPEGTVPIRRITLSEITRFDTLGHFLRKPGRRLRTSTKGLVRPDEVGVAAHQYAHASQAVANVGGHSVLGLWDPAVAASQVFSLSQQWYVAETPGGVLQTVEVGWHVYPGMYGHARPVLFTYWTADGYVGTGSYGTTAGDFVQVSTTYAPGMALDAWSAPGGAQVELELAAMLQDGNWWIFVGGIDPDHALGYYPASLYQGGPLATGATSADYGGEAVGDDSYPPMGSGSFAALGRTFAAHHRNIYYFPSEDAAIPATLTASQDWPDGYTVVVDTAADWGTHFFFGGPGGPVPVGAPVANADADAGESLPRAGHSV